MRSKPSTAQGPEQLQQLDDCPSPETVVPVLDLVDGLSVPCLRSRTTICLSRGRMTGSSSVSLMGPGLSRCAGGLGGGQRVASERGSSHDAVPVLALAGDLRATVRPRTDRGSSHYVTTNSAGSPVVDRWSSLSKVVVPVSVCPARSADLLMGSCPSSTVRPAPRRSGVRFPLAPHMRRSDRIFGLTCGLCGHQ